jgi:hypothetical protein
LGFIPRRGYPTREDDYETAAAGRVQTFKDLLDAAELRRLNIAAFSAEPGELPTQPFQSVAYLSDAHGANRPLSWKSIAPHPYGNFRSFMGQLSN